MDAILFISIILPFSFAMSNRCCDINNRKLPEYKLMRHNARSDQFIISRSSVRTISECKEFASSKKALAFNYESSKERSARRTHSNPSIRNSKHSCQVLECPEGQNFTSVLRDRNYKYYSMYPSQNAFGIGISSCIPKVGLFVISHRSMNYSQAKVACQDVNGSLAHVASEERTNGLAKLVPPETPVFVGLSNRDSERIWKNEYDEPLSCFQYRAWGEGEPSHSRGCVGLVQMSNNLPPFWSVVPCFAELPFICEIAPTYESNKIHQHWRKH